ncbi:MAG: hypothetical protein WB511_13300 [Nitrososphaeraceae archaeon]
MFLNRRLQNVHRTTEKLKYESSFMVTILDAMIADSISGVWIVQTQLGYLRVL